MSGPRSKWTLLGAAFALALTAGLTGATASTTITSTPSDFSTMPAHALPDKTVAGSATAAVTVAGGTTTVPANATSVMMQVVVTGGVSDGSLRVAPRGSNAGPTANIRWTAGATVTAQVTVAVGTQAKVNLRNGGTGSVQVHMTLIGYYAPAGATGPAGGVLTGTYPNPGLAAKSVTHNNLSPTGGASGDVLTNNGSGVIWQTPNYASAYTDTVVVHPTGDTVANGTALQNAVASGKHLVVLEPGVYATSTVAIPDGVDIVGAGMDLSKILVDGAGSAITATGTGTISDVSIVQTAGAAATAQAVSLSGTAYLTLQRVAIKITSTDGGANSFIAGVVVNNAATLVMDDSTVTAGGPQNYVEGVLIDSSSAYVTIVNSTVLASNAGTGNQTFAVNAFGPTTIRNSTISGTATAAGLGNAASVQASGVALNVYGSVLTATAYAAGSYAGTLNVAQTQISGLAGHNPSAVLVCVGDFNANFAALSASCA